MRRTGWLRGAARGLRYMIPADLRDAFERDGFIAVRDFLPTAQFAALKSSLLRIEADCRSQQQGDTVTTRVPVDAELLRTVPTLAALLDNRKFRGIMAYVASTRSEPLYYLQAIAGGIASGPPDPQLELHSELVPAIAQGLAVPDRC